MKGMHPDTGGAIDDDVEHIRRSIQRILTTPAGSRVMRREFGSLVPDLIDYPDSPANRLRLVAASYMAVIRWEPRVHFQSAEIQTGMDGKVSIDLRCQRVTGPRAGASINLSIPIK